MPMPINDAQTRWRDLVERREEVLPPDDLVDGWEFEGEHA
jgi:hypothetical protein